MNLGPGDQRSLSTRGRATITVIGILVLCAALISTLTLRSGERPESPVAVSAASETAGAPALPEAPFSLPAELYEKLPVARESFERAVEAAASDRANADSSDMLSAAAQMVDWVEVQPDQGVPAGPYRVEYTMDVDLTRKVLSSVRRLRVKRGHVIVMDPNNGRILAYVSTDPEAFPAQRTYPAASLVKLVTAAAALHYAPELAHSPCRYRGNPYRLTRSRLYPPRSGNEISLERALATSNNQCFAQLAVNAVGGEALVETFAKFGFGLAPAPGHAPGIAVLGDDDYDLGRLGSGLGGSHITPLQAAQLATILAHGKRIQPWWIDRVLDSRGNSLEMHQQGMGERVMTTELADELRQMLVGTTTRGTARSAFRDRRGRPKLGSIAVSGKTGNLSGANPKGRYEWFIGVAPAEAPEIAIAVVQVHGHLWWSKSSQIAADILSEVFCERGRCEAQLASRYTGSLGSSVAPVFLSDSGNDGG